MADHHIIPCAQFSSGCRYTRLSGHCILALVASVLVVLQAPIVDQNVWVFDQQKLSGQQDGEVVKAAQHLLQVCKLYISGQSADYLNTGVHQPLVLDMLLTSIVSAAPLMKQGEDGYNTVYLVLLSPFATCEYKVIVATEKDVQAQQQQHKQIWPQVHHIVQPLLYRHPATCRHLDRHFSCLPTVVESCCTSRQQHGWFKTCR